MSRKLRVPSVALLAGVAAFGCAAQDAVDQVEEDPAAEVVSEPTEPTDISVTEEIVPPSGFRPAPVRDASDTLGVLQLVEELRMAPTGAEWLSWHPEAESSLAPFSGAYIAPLFGRNTPWCVRSVTTDSLPGGSVVERMVYFYRESHPTVEADFALPPLEDRLNGILELCRAGLASISIADSANHVSVAEGMREVLNARLGDGQPITNDELLSAFRIGSAYFNEIVRWPGNDMTAVSYRHRDGSASTFAHNSNMAGPGGVRYGAELPPLNGIVVDEAVQLAELEPATIEDMAELRRQGSTRGVSVDAELLLDAVRKLTAQPANPGTEESREQRASRFLVAHDLLQTVALHGVPFSSPEGDSYEQLTEAAAQSIQPYRELGARYFSLSGGEFEYSGSLLDSAVVVAPVLSRLGDMLQMLTLQRSCSWRRVVEGVPDLLGRASDPQMIGRLHYMRAQGYATVVGENRGTDQVPLGTHAEEAPAARLAAIEQYKAVIAVSPEPGLKERAWRAAWLLSKNFSAGSPFTCWVR